jgi:hypothetical protein
MHTIRQRAPTEAELKRIKWNDRPDWVGFGCLSLLFGGVSGYLLSCLGARLGGLVSAEIATYTQMAGWALGGLIAAVSIISYVPFDRRRQVRAKKDAEACKIQIVTVTDARVVELVEIGDRDPALAFEIGAGKILLLQGQWLRDLETYGAPPPESGKEDEYGEEYVNGLPPPFAFPSNAFTVARLEHSGEVFGIEVQGEYLKPDPAVDALTPEYEFGDSELVDGRIDALAEAFAMAHQSRQAESQP